MKVICDYCSNEAVLVSGEVIYPHRPDLFSKHFYNCAPCDAYVGTHKGTKTPLGRLANFELRAAKKRAHAAFDPLWKSKSMSRASAYKLLASVLDIEGADCHIGMFDIDMCNRVVEVVNKFKKQT